jgi:hypothetical protein
MGTIKKIEKGIGKFSRYDIIKSNNFGGMKNEKI